MTTAQAGRRERNRQRTRDRIVEATVSLHTTVGPARTSISAIAERAGVQRHTVYAHFPDEAQLFAACMGHWMARHVPPDPSDWDAVPAGEARVRTVVGAVYAYWEETAAELIPVMADIGRVPAMDDATAFWDAQARAWAEAALRGTGLRGRRRTRAIAAMLHALALPTWRSLTTSGGLARADAVDLMAGLVDLAAGGLRPAGSRGSAA
jgi:AcrR family transcriptional regulator